MGPGRCVLCETTPKDIQHIFLLCPTTCSIRFGVLDIPGVTMEWNTKTLDACLRDWYAKYKALCTLYFYIIWGI